MPEEKERPRPHGDPLRDEIDTPIKGREEKDSPDVDETDDDEPEN